MTDSYVIYEKALEIIITYAMKYKSENLFLCISGLETEIVKYSQNKVETFAHKFPQYYILPIYTDSYEFDFNEIVKVRNNKKISKIIILTNGSLKNIDSLKDFNQINFKNIDSEILWNILKETDNSFNMHTNNDTLRNYLKNIIEVVNPELSSLIKYIDRVNETASIYNNFNIALNSNLFILGMWSCSSSAFLNKTRIRAIYTNSNPIQIQKKIKSPKVIDNIKKVVISENLDGRFKNITEQKRILKYMFYHRTYNEAFKEVCYEYVEQIMKGGERKKKIKTENKENMYKYTNIYGLMIGELMQIDNINVNAENLLDLEKSYFPRTDELNSEDELIKDIKILYQQSSEEKNRTIHVKFEKMQEEWQNFYSIFKNKINDNSLLSKLIDMNQNLNIPNNIKIELNEKIKNFCNSRSVFLENLPSPINLNECLVTSNNYINSFFDIIKYLFTLDENIIFNIAGSELFSSLLNVDITVSDDELYVPYYNPLMIFHLHIIKNRMEESLKNLDKINNYKLKILEFENKKLLNDYIVFNERLFALSHDNDNFPYYAKYVINDRIDSICNIDANNIYQYLYSYINQFPYKNELKICLIGDIDINTLKITLVRLLNKISSKTNLKSFKLHFVMKNGNKVRQNLITSIENQELLKNNLECHIDYPLENSDIDEYMDYIFQENDVAIFLDSRLIYEKPTFNYFPGDKLRISLKYRSFSNEINSFSCTIKDRDVSMPLLPNVINTLQHSIITRKLEPGVWDKYKLNSQIISRINKLITKSNIDKTILLFSSNVLIDEQIYDFNNITSIDEDISENKSIKIVKWQKTSNNFKEDNIPVKSNKKIIFSALDLINNIYNYFAEDEYFEKYENLNICISYGNYPKEIIFEYSTNDENDDNSYDYEENMIDIKKSIADEIFDSFIKCAIFPELTLDYYIKDNLSNILLKSSKNIEDIVFVYSFAHNYNNLDNCALYNRGIQDFEMEEGQAIKEISSLTRNSIYSILKFIGAELMSQNRIEVLRKMVHTSEITDKIFIDLLNITKSYVNSEMKYLVENVEIITKEFEV